MKKILVTGGTLFVSRYVAEYYIAAGNEVYVFNRNTHPQPDGTKLISGDKTQLNPQLKEHSFDIVIAVNIYTETEMKNLLDSLGDFREIIFISSSAVYPETTKLPFKVGDPVGRNSIWGDYGSNKIAAEKILQSRCPDAYILRPPYFYGKYQNIYREGFVFDCAMRKMPFYIPEDGTMPLQFYNVSDLCSFMDKIITDKPKQKIYNVGNREVVDINTFVEICYDIAGTKLEKRFVDNSHNQRSYFPFHKYGYNLDVEPQYDLVPDTISLYDGLKEDFSYYINHQDEVMKKNSYFEYIENVLK